MLWLCEWYVPSSIKIYIYQLISPIDSLSLTTSTSTCEYYQVIFPKSKNINVSIKLIFSYFKFGLWLFIYNQIFYSLETYHYPFHYWKKFESPSCDLRSWIPSEVLQAVKGEEKKKCSDCLKRMHVCACVRMCVYACILAIRPVCRAAWMLGMLLVDQENFYLLRFFFLSFSIC